ncbi:glycosyltransferase family 1 protein [Rhodococcus sp. NPDC003382]
MRSVRVASVPASHVYVRHLADPDGDGVTRMPDPVPADGRTVPGGWWPPLMLEPGWVTEHHHEFDVFHVHFGFDAIEPAQLEDIVAELDDHRIPLVYTVHDLRNPHHDTPGAHEKQLDVLIRGATELITLTPGAAARIHEVWGRSATVVPHPHVVEKEWFDRPRPAEDRFVVGVHAKSLRANMDVLPIVETLSETIGSLPGAILRIDLHDEIFDPGNHWYAPDTGAALTTFADRPGVEVLVHPYFSDDELWRYLSSLTVSVLPYRFGTHSGWLEACHDLGTAVAAPSCGFYGQQQPCAVFEFDEHRFDPDSLDRGIRDLYHRPRPLPRPAWESRLAQRRNIARTHRDLYERALRERGRS